MTNIKKISIFFLYIYCNTFNNQKDDSTACLNGGAWDYLLDMCDCDDGYSGMYCEIGNKKLQLNHNLIYSKILYYEFRYKCHVQLNKQMLVYTEPQKCICEHKNGVGPRGIFLCEVQGVFERLYGCATNEWCVGPYDTKDAIGSTSDFCKEGRMA